MGLRAKIPKCASLALRGSTGHIRDPNLHLGGSKIPFMGNRTVTFLGFPTTLPDDTTMARTSSKSCLERMLQAVDQCPVSRKQKLMLYRLGICPRLNWPLTIHEFSLSWIKRNLEAPATRYLKRWAGLTRSTNPNLLYLPRSSGGLNLPVITSLYKKLQVSKQTQILMSGDPCVRRIAEKGLQLDMQAKRSKFLPAVEVNNTLIDDLSLTRSST